MGYPSRDGEGACPHSIAALHVVGASHGRSFTNAIGKTGPRDGNGSESRV